MLISIFDFSFFFEILGSEWDYVIISLVRSVKRDEIDLEPSLSWLRNHLGFLTDEHQMNVGLTRARRGLCIIGEICSFTLTAAGLDRVFTQSNILVGFVMTCSVIISAISSHPLEQ